MYGMSLVVELKHDEALFKIDDLKNEVHSKTQERVSLIDLMKDREMIREEKNTLNEIVKKPLVFLIKLKTKERNDPEEALKVKSSKDLHYAMHHVSHFPFHIFFT